MRSVYDMLNGKYCINNISVLKKEKNGMTCDAW